MKIALNARQDLYEAGFVCDDDQVEAFEAEYIAEAAKYAAKHALDIHVVCG